MFISDILFANRKDAAEQLALRLEKYKYKNALVIGISNGGVEVGYYIARRLNAELSIIVSRKIAFREHPEYAVGAVCEEGTVFLDNEWDISEGWITETLDEIKEEIKQKAQLYRGGKPLPKMKGRTAILVDDGIDSGAALVAAMLLCAKHGAEKIVIAAPVAGDSFEEKIYNADELIILHRTEYFRGVGNAYEEFSELTDEDILLFLKLNREKR